MGLSFSRTEKLTTTLGSFALVLVPRGCDSDSPCGVASGVALGVGVAAGRGARRDCAREGVINANAQSATAKSRVSAKRVRGTEMLRARTSPRVVDLFG